MTAPTDTSWQPPAALADFAKARIAGRLWSGDDHHDRDQGGVLRSAALAVLTPASVTDIAKTMQWCHNNGLQAVPRGTGHMTNGQSLGGDNCLQIDMCGLSKIHEITETHVEVDAGVLWRDLVDAVWERKLRVESGLTGYLGLTVGGTLSAGGISTVINTGAQVDYVTAVEVVTGAGEIMWCDADHNRDLMDAVLGGLGQVGIITRVRLRLAPAKMRVKTLHLQYPLAQFSQLRDDMRTVATGEGDDEVLAMLTPAHDTDDGPDPGMGVLRISRYYDTVVPADEEMLAGLNITRPSEVFDASYLEFVKQFDAQIEQFRDTEEFDQRHKPWADFFFTTNGITQFTDEIVPCLTHEDRGHRGWILVFAKRREQFSGPLPALPVPDKDSDGLVWLFDVLTVSDETNPDGAWDDRLWRRNQHLWTIAQGYGARVYPIGSIHVIDWRSHFGAAHTRFLSAQQLYDPLATLKSAGPGRLK